MHLFMHLLMPCAFRFVCKQINASTKKRAKSDTFRIDSHRFSAARELRAMLLMSPDGLLTKCAMNSLSNHSCNRKCRHISVRIRRSGAQIISVLVKYCLK